MCFYKVLTLHFGGKSTYYFLTFFYLRVLNPVSPSCHSIHFKVTNIKWPPRLFLHTVCIPDVEQNTEGYDVYIVLQHTPLETYSKAGNILISILICVYGVHL